MEAMPFIYGSYHLVSSEISKGIFWYINICLWFSSTWYEGILLPTENTENVE